MAPFPLKEGGEKKAGAERWMAAAAAGEFISWRQCPFTGRLKNTQIKNFNQQSARIADKLRVQEGQRRQP